MTKSSKIDIGQLLTEHWPLIMQAYAQTIGRKTFSEDQVKVLKTLSDVGVLDLMWSKTAHDFTETMDIYLNDRSLESLNPDETAQLIADLVKHSSKWFTRTIQCNWK
jgi:hypothetical protein